MRAKPSVFMMVIVAATLFLGCGSQEQAQISDAEGALPPVSAEGEIAIPDSVASCLQLFMQEFYEDAIPACTEALQDDPGNMEVQDALASAQRNVTAEVSALDEEALNEEAMKE